MPTFYVKKFSGEKQLFDPAKLEASLKKIGTKEDIIKEIIAEVAQSSHDGITTQEIYRKAYAILHTKHHSAAIRYSLKKAVAELGPTGFPFEKFIAEIFKAQGYETLVDQIVQGKCVQHEVDVVAWNEKEMTMVEAKFHTDFNLKSDLKIVLYVKARYDDLSGNEYSYGGKNRELVNGWVITNTKFSSMAIQYAECQMKLKLLGWNYPYNNNLHDMIERYKLIPLTALSSITTEEKGLFLAAGIVIAKSLLDEKFLNDFHLSAEKIAAIQKEIGDLHAHLDESIKE